MRSKALVLSVLLAELGAVALGAAQEAKQEKTISVVAEAGSTATAPVDHLIVFPDGQAGDYNTFAYIGAQPLAESKVIKGVPYSAEGVSEIVRTLADGNRIVRRNSALIYRDSEGRVRREQTLEALGPWAAEGSPPKTISIFDPVRGLSFSTTERVEVAVAPAGAAGAATAGPAKHFEVKVARPATAAPLAARTSNRPLQTPVVESLGTKMMEGLEVEGSRSTTVIPAGEIGNEQPIQIVNETWFSPELQTIIFSRNNDPLVGEATFRLTKINRSEPDPQLFHAPEGVNIQERSGPAVIQKMREK